MKFKILTTLLLTFSLTVTGCGEDGQLDLSALEACTGKSSSNCDSDSKSSKTNPKSIKKKKKKSSNSNSRVKINKKKPPRGRS